MIAALGMYERPQTRAAHDRFWSFIRDGMRDRGLAAPTELTRGEMAFWPAWRAHDLVLGQTCGLPYRAELAPHVTLIGTPDYGVANCVAGYYRSAYIVRADDPRSTLADYATARFALNDPLSHSGWAAPLADCAMRNIALHPVAITGSHAASALAVAEGRADFAAVDAVTWLLLCRYESFTAGLRVLGHTAQSPGLPLIAAKGAAAQATFAALEQAMWALSSDDRDTRQLRGLCRIPAETYLALPIPAAPALAKGDL